MTDGGRIVLDTNVLAETIRPEPAEQVIQWLNQQPAHSLFITTMTEAEIRYGIEILPAGRRRDRLLAAAERAFRDLFHERILPFDRIAAGAYARIAADRKAIGRPITTADCQIAAIAYAHGAAVATRNDADFMGTGIDVRNPWT